MALTSNAAQVAGLGRIYFELLVADFADLRRINPLTPEASTISSRLIIRFLFPILESKYATEKNRFVPDFPKTLSNVHKHLATSIAFAFRS